MKNVILRSLFFSSLLILVLSSCSKDEPSQSIIENAFSAKIDGELFEANTVISGIVGEEQELFSFTQFSITAFKTNGSYFDKNMLIFFTLPFDESLEEISYDFTSDNCTDLTNNICAYMLYSTGVEDGKAGVSNLDSGNSRFTITSIDFKPGGHAKGTFSGVLKDENTDELIEVTEGKFNVKIIE